MLSCFSLVSFMKFSFQVVHLRACRSSSILCCLCCAVLTASDANTPIILTVSANVVSCINDGATTEFHIYFSPSDIYSVVICCGGLMAAHKRIVPGVYLDWNGVNTSYNLHFFVLTHNIDSSARLCTLRLTLADASCRPHRPSRHCRPGDLLSNERCSRASSAPFPR